MTRTRLSGLAFFPLLILLSNTSPAQKNSPEKKGAEPTAQTTAKPEDKEPSKDEDPLFKGMKYRLVGPYRGGRSLTASGIPGDPTTYYFGATGGGVWKSTDGALTWMPVFDKEGSGAIGSLAVSISDPNIVYVGTGEACLRGNIAQGGWALRHRTSRPPTPRGGSCLALSHFGRCNPIPANGCRNYRRHPASANQPSCGIRSDPGDRTVLSGGPR